MQNIFLEIYPGLNIGESKFVVPVDTWYRTEFSILCVRYDTDLSKCDSIRWILTL